MAAGKSSKDFANLLAGNRTTTKTEQVETVVQEPKVKAEDKPRAKETVLVKQEAPKPAPKKEEPVAEKSQEKKERVRDASTILSLLLTPEQKAFIKFEAEIRKISMNEYICSLIQDDYQRDKEMFTQYQAMMQKLQK